MTRRSQAARPYRAPKREEAAGRTRRAILAAAQSRFERSGWAGTTLPAVAAEAGVSVKTLEAIFGGKAALLRATVDFAIRGDERLVPIARREAVAAMQAARTAGEMLDLHAAQVRRISERSARLAWVVEHAAGADESAAELWRTMTANRRSGVRWATRTLLAKDDLDRTLERADVESAFWLALDWATYRSLTDGRGLTPRGFERWLRRYYRRMLFA